MENLKIHFNKVPEGEKEIAEGIVRRSKSKGVERIPGEYEKSGEELKAIRVINDLIQKKLREIEINPKDALVPNRVHLINQEIADSLDMKSIGDYDSEEESIHINKDRLKKRRIGMYKAILHETLHYYSFDSVIAVGPQTDINPHRSGYRVKNLESGNTSHQHLHGFNEAVVEKMTQEILRENEEYLRKEFNPSEGELKKEHRYGAFDDEIEILDLVISKMALSLKEEPKEIWQKFKKGLFSGEMMHLRDIEKIFGPGSLRVLSAMSSKGSTKDMPEGKMFDTLEKFFNSEDQKERNTLAKQILSERERLQYEKTVKNDEAVKLRKQNS